MAEQPGMSFRARTFRRQSMATVHSQPVEPALQFRERIMSGSGAVAERLLESSDRPTAARAGKLLQLRSKPATRHQESSLWLSKMPVMVSWLEATTGGKRKPATM